MTTEFFPPTQQELEEIINILQKKLEDERFKDEWEELNEELKEKENQLNELLEKQN